MSDVDPRFQAQRQQAAARQRRARRGRRVVVALVGLVVLAGLGTAGWLTRDKWHLRGPKTVVVAGGQTLEAVGEAGHQTLSAFVNLPGDPMRLHLEAGAAGPGGESSLPRPADLGADRGAGKLTLIQDAMISGQEHVLTTLPSSQEDFAVFQAQRRGLQTEAAAAGGGGPAPAAPAPTTDGATTLSVAVRDAPLRHPLTEDVVVRLTSDRPLAEVLAANRLTPAEAQEVAAAAQADLGVTDLMAGQLLALRGVPGADGALQFRQLSLYKADHSYVGSLARADGAADAAGVAGAPGPIVAGADPWVDNDLFAHADAAPAPAPAAHYRVLDAFYSAALRHQLPSTLVGQMIMLLSEAHDLDVEATPADRMTVLYAPDPGSAPPGLAQVLYIAIKGTNVTVDCYVFPPAPGADYACFGKSRDKVPVQPKAAASGSGAPAESDSAAVAQLVDRIITIESGGKADAKNPLSDAVGIGQFIGSTWLRMMRTYRPDLVIANTPDQLLAMRNDPVISREMVVLLTKESEAYLRARGHEITPGRLYLAHFLGVGGADTVLNAPPDTPLLPLIGQPAITANPFLAGQDASFVIDWAEQKMAGAANAAAFREPAGLDAFRALVGALLPTG